jgi:rare lipoprotein A (peptidoglycan hydrolase)
MKSERRRGRALGIAFGLALALGLPACDGADSSAPRYSTTAIAAKVAKQAKRTEKQEGTHDLVKDSVRTTTTAQGQQVIVQVGEASFYGTGFHGNRTASGMRFNHWARTAAHPTLPLGTEAKVTHLETGKSVQVQITDRGPYAKGRNIDLSQAAARAIGLTPHEGEAPVRIEAVVPAPSARVAAAGVKDGPGMGRKRG